MKRVMFVLAMVAGLLAPLAPAQASTIQYVTPEMVLARIYGPQLINGQLYVSCRLDAGYGKALWFDDCGVNRQDAHWYGNTEHEMWRRRTYYIRDNQRVIIVTHDGFTCEHGKRYQAWSYGKSTGFANVAEGSARTNWKTFC